MDSNESSSPTGAAAASASPPSYPPAGLGVRRIGTMAAVGGLSGGAVSSSFSVASGGSAGGSSSRSVNNPVPSQPAVPGFQGGLPMRPVVVAASAQALPLPASHSPVLELIHGHPCDQFLELEKLEEFGVPVKCAICTEVLRNATETSCHHLFCSTCIRTSLKNKLECPVCRTKPLYESDLRPSGAIDRMIQQQKVYCPNRKADGGCQQWIGALSDVKKHMTSCAFHHVECTECHELVLRGELTSHAERCPMRKVLCGECKQGMPFRDLSFHQQEECEMTIVACPRSCGVSDLVRRDIKHHLAEQCRLQICPCPYRDIGCAVSIPRAQMETHLLQKTETHLQGVMRAFVKQRRQMQSLAAVVERLRDRLQETKAELSASKRREMQHARILANMRALPSSTTHIIRMDNLKAKSQQFPTGTFWESPPFETPGGGRWALRCYLNGWTEADKDDIGVFLSASNNTDPVITIRTMYTITLTDPYASVTFEKCYRDEFWGAPSFVPRTDVADKDSIVFQVELKVLGMGEEQEDEDDAM